MNSRKSSTAAASFGFRELAAATRGFKEVNLIGEGGFGRVYKGRLSTGEASFIHLDVNAITTPENKESDYGHLNCV